MSQMRYAALRRFGWIAAIASTTTLCGIGVAAARPVARRAAAATLSTHNTKRGTVLAASNGHTLYMFTQDKGTTSECSGSCASVWLPLLTSGHAVAAKGSGVNSKLLGTTRRTNGQVQVTYHGHALYTYTHDKKPGQINGEGANQFGGRWYVLGTSGNPIKPKSGGSACNPVCQSY